MNLDEETLRRRGIQALVVAIVIAAFALVLFVAAATPAMAQSPVRPYRANDFGHTVLNVMPPGQKGVFAGAEAVQAQAACPATGTSCSANPADYPPYTIDQLLRGHQCGRMGRRPATHRSTERQGYDHREQHHWEAMRGAAQ